MLTLFILGLVATVVARRLGAPGSLQQGIMLGVMLLILAQLVAVPSARPDMATIMGWGQGLMVVGIIAVPVMVYALAVGWLRRWNGAVGTVPEPVAAVATGPVLIADDRALQADIGPRRDEAAAARAPWAPERFSIIQRGSAGQVEAAASVTLNMGLAEISELWPAPAGEDADADAAESASLAEALLQEIEAEVARRGAARAVVEGYSWQDPDFFEGRGYRPGARLPYPAGPERVYWTKDLGA